MDLFGFMMYLFENGKPEEFLLFVRNLNTILATSGVLEMDTKTQFLCTLVCGEALSQFDLFSADMESIETLNVEYIIKSL